MQCSNKYSATVNSNQSMMCSSTSLFSKRNSKDVHPEEDLNHRPYSLKAEFQFFPLCVTSSVQSKIPSSMPSLRSTECNNKPTQCNVSRNDASNPVNIRIDPGASAAFIPQSSQKLLPPNLSAITTGWTNTLVMNPSDNAAAKAENAADTAKAVDSSDSAEHAPESEAECADDSALYGHSPDLFESAKYFRDLDEAAPTKIVISPQTFSLVGIRMCYTLSSMFY